MERREEHLLEKRNLTINMDKKIAAIFKDSMNVSGIQFIWLFILVERGKSHKLLRKALIKEEKSAKILEQEELKKEVMSIPSLKYEISQLRNEILSKEEEIEKNRHDSGILVRLFDMGVIDENGNLLDQHHKDDMN